MNMSGNNHKTWLFVPRLDMDINEILDNGILYVGHDELGDFSKYNKKLDIKNTVGKPGSGTPNTVWDFLSMNCGDVVYLKDKKSQRIVSKGEILSRCKWNSSRKLYKNTINVKWDKNEYRMNYTDKHGIMRTSGNEKKMIYDKTLEEVEWVKTNAEEQESVNTNGVLSDYLPYAQILLKSNNIIFRGAPGTGKTYLAHQVASNIVSNGSCYNFNELSDEQKKQIGFVQFHPSYDYTDFVEGLRPVATEDGSMGFELKDGVFKDFVNRARENYENYYKPDEEIAKESKAQDDLISFMDNIELGSTLFKTIKGSGFYVIGYDDKKIRISITGNVKNNDALLSVRNIRKALESDDGYKSVEEYYRNVSSNKFSSRENSYEYALYKRIKESKSKKGGKNVIKEPKKNYVFIIDEINRGEISKILGELFFAIDPGYRGPKGAVATQYANMHDDTDEKFYIPENVYIIGTMNDIDRSVDSFDFAMRRRFRFIEIKAEDNIEMLDLLDDEAKSEEAKKRMASLNKAILDVQDLNENYQIGPAYFLKLKELDFDELWTDCLEPLLEDYVRGMYDEKDRMKDLKSAYDLEKREGTGF